MTNCIISLPSSFVNTLGAVLFGNEGLIVNETPSDDDLAKCKELGENLAK